jgi:hypothetical protein
MEWYFNFESRRGLAFHQYALPGRPASHGCVRLLKRDATWLYKWGESWRLTPDGKEVVQHGTPVYIVGEYGYEGPKPWLDAASWNNRLTIARSVAICESVPHRVASPLLIADEAGAPRGEDAVNE